MSGTTATITKAGYYLVDGQLTNGQLMVDTPDDNNAAAIIRHKGGLSYNIGNYELTPMVDI